MFLLVLQVKEVLWNIESTVLAVWCEDLPQEGDTTDITPKSYSLYFIYYRVLMNCLIVVKRHSAKTVL